MRYHHAGEPVKKLKSIVDTTQRQKFAGWEGGKALSAPAQDAKPLKGAISGAGARKALPPSQPVNFLC